MQWSRSHWCPACQPPSTCNWNTLMSITSCLKLQPPWLSQDWSTRAEIDADCDGPCVWTGFRLSSWATPLTLVHPPFWLTQLMANTLKHLPGDFSCELCSLVSLIGRLGFLSSSDVCRWQQLGRVNGFSSEFQQDYLKYAVISWLSYMKIWCFDAHHKQAMKLIRTAME